MTIKEKQNVLISEQRLLIMQLLNSKPSDVASFMQIYKLIVKKNRQLFEMERDLRTRTLKEALILNIEAHEKLICIFKTVKMLCPHLKRSCKIQLQNIDNSRQKLLLMKQGLM